MAALPRLAPALDIAIKESYCSAVLVVGCGVDGAVLSDRPAQAILIVYRAFAVVCSLQRTLKHEVANLVRRDSIESYQSGRQEKELRQRKW